MKIEDLIYIISAVIIILFLGHVIFMFGWDDSMLKLMEEGWRVPL